MIKKIMLFTFVAVVLVGTAALTTQHYKDHQNKKAAVVASDKSTIQSLEKQLSQERATSAKYAQAYQDERLQCEVGRGVYVKVPAYLQKVTPQPKCGAAVLQ